MINEPNKIGELWSKGPRFVVSELSDRTTKIINSVGEHKNIEKETMMTFYSLSQKTQIQRNTHNYKQISHKNYRKI